MEEKKQGEKPSEALIHDFDKPNKMTILNSKTIIILVVIALIGVGSGYLFSQTGGKVGGVNVGGNTNGTSVSKGTIVGSDDLKTFKDTAEGTLKEGGIDGEGQFHLIRPGGDSQNVYLTSSSIDLSKYVGKKIKAWGQTFAAKKAGWLMDIGRLEVLE
jgi:hypothetical protein